MDNKRKQEEANQQSSGDIPNKIPRMDWDPNDVYEVEKVLDKKIVKGKLKYLVKWLDWGEEYNSWESAANLQDCTELIREFEAEYREARLRRRTMQKPQDSGDDNHDGPSEIGNAGKSNPCKSKPSTPQPKYGFSRKLKPESIIGATVENGVIKFLIKWKKTDITELVPASVANVRCTQLVIKFYEERVVWTNVKEDASAENDLSNPQNAQPEESDAAPPQCQSDNLI